MLFPDDLDFVGNDLNRPECVLATRSGHLYSADWRGGVVITFPDGQSKLLKHRTSHPWLKPNGIALMPEGNFLVTHLGDETGGVYCLDGNGILTPFLEEIENTPLPPTNFVCRDFQGRTWITVSTRLIPRHSAARPDHGDGFIVLKDEKGARIVADGLGFTNECVLDRTGSWLYVNETFRKRLSRFRIGKDGMLGNRETIAEFGVAEFPDGVIFDEEDHLWVTSIISNRLYRIAPDGSKVLWLEDCDEIGMEGVEAKYQLGQLEASDFKKVKPRILRNISSMAFGGKDLQTAWLGCLQGTSLATFRAPVRGLKPIHWDVLPDWLERLKSEDDKIG